VAAGNRAWIVVSALAVLVVLAVDARAAEQTTSARENVLRDDWMALYLRGQKIGYAHTRTVERQEDGRTLYLTNTFQKVSLGRSGTTVTVTVAEQVTEDAEGRLVAFSQVMDQGFGKMRTQGQVLGDKMILTVGSVPTMRTRTVDAPRGLCPWGVERLSRARGYEPGTSYSLTLFTPQAPTRDVLAQVTVREVEPVQVFEVTKWLHPVDVVLSILPGVTTTQWVDDEGVVWLARAKLLVFEIEERKVSKSVALEPADPVEVMAASAIAPDRPIPNPRGIRGLELLLSSTDPSGLGLELPSDPFQRVQERGGAVRLVLRKGEGDPARSYALPYDGNQYAGLLKPTPWLEVEDPGVVSMSREALAGETDALRAARRIELYVSREIRHKTLGMGFATAAETARQKAGDCTEHAVLVAALARAAGMPSRVVCGLAYGGPVPPDTVRKFYFHMWAEVYVGEWLPLDAALGGHDPTHIAIVRSALDETQDLVDIAAGIVPLLGTGRIKVLRIHP